MCVDQQHWCLICPCLPITELCTHRPDSCLVVVPPIASVTALKSQPTGGFCKSMLNNIAQKMCNAICLYPQVWCSRCPYTFFPTFPSFSLFAVLPTGTNKDTGVRRALGWAPLQRDLSDCAGAVRIRLSDLALFVSLLWFCSFSFVMSPLGSLQKGSWESHT